MIVGIETSSIDCSVALAADDGDGLLTDGWSGGHRHAREVLPRLVALADRFGEPLTAARVVAVGAGPGSFTGLRVGMSLAKGLAFAAGCPIVARPSLEAWLDAEPAAGAAIGRAGVNEAYLLVRGAAAPSIVRFADLPPTVRAASTVAPGDVAVALNLADAGPPFRAAAALVRDAARRLGGGDPGDDLDTLEPAYLRLPRGVEAVRGAVRCV